MTYFLQVVSVPSRGCFANSAQQPPLNEMRPAPVPALLPVAGTTGGGRVYNHAVRKAKTEIPD
jgi:hypothetical protein